VLSVNYPDQFKKLGFIGPEKKCDMCEKASSKLLEHDRKIAASVRRFWTDLKCSKCGRMSRYSLSDETLSNAEIRGMLMNLGN